MLDPVNLRYTDLYVGQSFSFEVKITPEVVKVFADFSGDTNPLHTDATYAATTVYKERIAHGMIIGSFFSRLIGMYLPGQSSVYLSQNLRFCLPIFLGRTIQIKGEIVHKTDALRCVKMQMTAVDVSTEDVVVLGDALVQVLK